MNEMKKFLRKYCDDIIGNGLYDILKFLVLTVIAVVVADRVTFIMIVQYLPAILGLILMMVDAIAALVIVCLIYFEYRKYLFKILKMEVIVEVSVSEIITTSIVKVKARRNGLDGIYSRYTWFDGEEASIDCLTEGMDIEELPRIDTSNEYRIKFGKKLCKGEEITYITKFTGTNTNNYFQNFYSREIVCPTRWLSLIVRFPNQNCFRKIEQSVICNSSYSQFTKTNIYECSNCYNWEIEKPKIGYEYKLRWY